MTSVVDAPRLGPHQLGPCLVCGDITVLPDCGGGRCLGCSPDQLDEPEREHDGAQLEAEPDEAEGRRADILAIFDEAQASVPPFKLIAASVGEHGSMRVDRHGLWLSRTGPKPRRYTPRTEGEIARRKLAYAERRVLGLCGLCGEPALPGKCACAYHAFVHRPRYLARRGSICWRCKAPTEGSVECSKCAALAAQRKRERIVRLREAGVCTRCAKSGAPPGRALCVACADAQRAKHRAQAAERRLLAPPKLDGRCCYRCNHRGPLTDFGKDSSRIGGRSYLCIQCERLRGRAKSRRRSGHRVCT